MRSVQILVLTASATQSACLETCSGLQGRLDCLQCRRISLVGVRGVANSLDKVGYVQVESPAFNLNIAKHNL